VPEPTHLHPRYHSLFTADGKIDPSSWPTRSSVTRNLSNAEAEILRALGDACVAVVHAQMLAWYGWTEISVEVEVDRSRRSLIAHGHVVLDSIGRRLDLALRTALGGYWPAVTVLTSAVATSEWFVGNAVTPLWRRCDDGRAASPELSTELVPDDGPVHLLATVRGRHLVYGSDRSVGWIDGPLKQSPRFVRRASRNHSWQEAAAAFIGVPYKSGGTTIKGIDCSGLTQRLYRDAAGITIPRNTRDQLSLGAVDVRPTQQGDLVFVREHEGAPWHVGVALLRDRDWSVLHASSTQLRVVEDSIESYARAGRRLKSVSVARIVRLMRRLPE